MPPVNIIKLRLKMLSPKRRRKSNTRSIRKKSKLKRSKKKKLSSQKPRMS